MIGSGSREEHIKNVNLDPFQVNLLSNCDNMHTTHDLFGPVQIALHTTTDAYDHL